MQYETAAQMAERLGVTVRIVQLWAKNDRLPGAIKQGRDWLIPAGMEKPGKENIQKSSEPILLPLTNAEYSPGSVSSYIESMTDYDKKHLALSEYYYFWGNPEKLLKSRRFSLIIPTQ